MNVLYTMECIYIYIKYIEASILTLAPFCSVVHLYISQKLENYAVYGTWTYQVAPVRTLTEIQMADLCISTAASTSETHLMCQVLEFRDQNP